MEASEQRPTTRGRQCLAAWMSAARCRPLDVGRLLVGRSMTTSSGRHPSGQHPAAAIRLKAAEQRPTSSGQTLSAAGCRPLFGRFHLLRPLDVGRSMSAAVPQRNAPMGHRSNGISSLLTRLHLLACNDNKPVESATDESKPSSPSSNDRRVCSQPGGYSKANNRGPDVSI